MLVLRFLKSFLLLIILIYHCDVGMISKIDAAEICLKNKCAMVIASGKNKKPIRNISTRTKQTWFIKK